MYRVSQVAKMLNYKERTVREWVRTGKVKAVKIMGGWRIPEWEVDRLKRGE